MSNLPKTIEYEVPSLVCELNVKERKKVSFYAGDLSLHDRALISAVIHHDEYGLLKMKIDNPNVFLDIGSHAGSFAVMVKAIYPDAIVHCFEPNPCILPILRENAKNYKGIIVHPYAVSSSKMTWISTPNGIHGPDIGASSVGDRKLNIQNRNSYPIQSVDINEAMNMTSEKEFCLAKFDCEGGEWDAFIGMTTENREKIHRFVGEWHNGTGNDFIAMANKHFSKFVFNAITDINHGQGRFIGLEK